MTTTKRLLIIDDDLTVSLICRHIIKMSYPEITVISMTDPAKALEFIKAEYTVNPQQTIVLLDINMPMLTGWELLDELQTYGKAIQEYLSIYIFSSSVNGEDKKRSRQHPLVIDFVEKPLSIQKLKKLITDEQNRLTGMMPLFYHANSNSLELTKSYCPLVSWKYSPHLFRAGKIKD